METGPSGRDDRAARSRVTEPCPAPAVESATGSPFGPVSVPGDTQTVPVRRRKVLAPGTAHFFIPREWLLMAPLFALMVALIAVLTRTTPPPLSIAFAVGATMVASCTSLAVRYERQVARNVWQRFALMQVGVAMPMLLYGIGLADWGLAGEASWNAIIGALVATGTIASLIVSGRLPTVITVHGSLWTGIAVLSNSLAASIMLGIGAGLGVYTAIRQFRVERIATQERQEILRIQTRAEEILLDYEQTGQGWFWETDRKGTIAYVSPPICRLLGHDDEGLDGQPFTDLFDLDAFGQEGERTLTFHLSARSSFHELGVRAATGEEDERWWSISGRPIYDDYNNFMGFRGSGNDLTERKRSQENASRLAHYDSLTGLANRFQMSQTLEKILGSQQADHRACTVLLLDLDRFKQVNDTMGHPAGDALLKQVAQRLERTVDKRGRVGRLGGDEFEVILPGHNDREETANLARKVIENLSQPYSIDGHRVVIGASVGIALSPDDGVTSEALIRNADLALYAAKDAGRGRHHFYASDLHDDAEERRQLEQDLRDALIHGGLELHYQPVVQVTTEKMTGFEALIRWTHPTRGPLSPAKFIPIAEDAGLIAPIGEWALRTACHDMAKWPDSVRVAVNVSPLQFANPALPAIVTSALAEAQIHPSRLELEITESVFLNDDEGTDAMFAALKRVGVRLALDDFGTGYSSLGYLKKAPFDKIKIDQSFVRGATVPGSRNGAIIASIVSLAEALGMETTAEGVETLDELDLVRMLGCSHVQGYIYERPLTHANATAKLAEGLTAVARGPRSARANRQTMLRKVIVESGTEHYTGTVRNISATGAMIEGLWNVPPGTIFQVRLSDGVIATATARWCQEDRMGVEFANPLALDDLGRVNSNSAFASRQYELASLRRKTA